MSLFKTLSPTWNRFALSLLFALLMSLSFPPLQLGFLAYWGLIPLFFLLQDLSIKQAMKWGYFSGFLWNLATLYWIAWVTLPGLIGLILVLPIYMLLYSWLHVLFARKFGWKFIFLMPFIWVTIEFIKSLGSIGFPWTSLAYTQTYYTDLIQYASITGAYGVSFWVFWINVILFVLIWRKPKLKQALLYISILILLFVIPFIYAKFTIPRSDEIKEDLEIALVQGNIDPYLKWDQSFQQRNFTIYDSLTRAINNDGVQLIVWPETATATFLRYNRYYSRLFENLVDNINTPILTGSPDYERLPDGEYKTYNGLLLLQPFDHYYQTYWKMQLVPFGERVPFEDTVPFLHNFFESLNMGTGDFAPGKEYKLLHINWKNELLPLAGVICYESVFPNLVRKMIKKGGRILVIVTNDAWYGNTSGPYQHAQIAVFRAIENRVSIARCANTGISSFIDPYGHVIAKTRFNQQTTLIGKIPLRQETTIYTHYGDLFSFIAFGVSVTTVIFAILRRNTGGSS